MAGTAGRSGRRPKPTARKELAGNPGKRALNKEEPVFTPIKGVAPPDWFSEDDGLPMAAVMWELTTKELCGQGLLCVTDLAVLERWCVAYEFWRRAVADHSGGMATVYCVLRLWLGPERVEASTISRGLHGDTA